MSHVGNRPDAGIVNIDFKKGKTDDGSGNQNTPGNMGDDEFEVIGSDDDEVMVTDDGGGNQELQRIPIGYEAYKDKMSLDSYNIMCKAALETFDFTFGKNNEENEEIWDAVKNFLQDENKMHVDEKNNLSIYEGGRRVTIDGQYFKEFFVDDVQKHGTEIQQALEELSGKQASSASDFEQKIVSLEANQKETLASLQKEHEGVILKVAEDIQDIFADFILNAAKYRVDLPQRGRARSNSSAGLEEFSNNYFEKHNVPSVVEMVEMEDMVPKKGGGGNQFLAPPGNQGNQVLGGNKIQKKKNKVVKSIGRLYRDNNMVRSSSINLDEIAEALYDNIDELMGYVHEQDDLIANQLEQISYLEREIENAANRFRPRRRRRRYGRDDIYYC